MEIDNSLFALSSAELAARTDVSPEVKATTPSSDNPFRSEIERQWLYAEASDSYKEVHGIRCRWMHSATREELVQFISELRAEARL